MIKFYILNQNHLLSRLPNKEPDVALLLNENNPPLFC